MKDRKTKLRQLTHEKDIVGAVVKLKCGKAMDDVCVEMTKKDKKAMIACLVKALY